MSQHFGVARKSAKRLWLEQTKRRRYINDRYRDSFECQWQLTYCPDEKHNSWYCSIGEWNTHITDLLCDDRYDKFDYSVKRHQEALFRWYTRFLLVSSEILTDFEDFYKKVSGEKQNAARSHLSSGKLSFTFSQLFAFINNICKHKSGESISAYHTLNHHRNYDFADFDSHRTSHVVTVGDFSASNDSNSLIQMPRLDEIIWQILYCYATIDTYLQKNYASIKSKLAGFEVDLDMIPE